MLTGQGLWCAGAGIALALAPFWLPQPGAVALGGALLGALGAAALLTPRSLRAVRARWLVPERVHAGQEVTLGAEFHTPSGCAPFELEAWQPGSRRSEVVAKLPALPRRGGRTRWTVRFPRRGPVALPALIGRSRQPFGLVTAQRPISDPAELLVLPALGTVERALIARLSAWLEAHAAGHERGDDDPAGLRPYRAGDPPRSIHWKATARTGDLVVLERDAATCRHLALVVDLRSDAARPRLIEAQIAAAATLVDHLCTAGCSLDLRWGGQPGGVLGGRDRLLEALALAGSSAADPLALVPIGRPALILATQPLTAQALRPRPLVLTADELPALLRLPGSVT